jgi:hypothetical protein
MSSLVLLLPMVSHSLDGFYWRRNNFGRQRPLRTIRQLRGYCLWTGVPGVTAMDILDSKTSGGRYLDSGMISELQ